jgi:hypothetical protein
VSDVSTAVRGADIAADSRSQATDETTARTTPAMQTAPDQHEAVGRGSGVLSRLGGQLWQATRTRDWNLVWVEAANPTAKLHSTASSERCSSVGVFVIHNAVGGFFVVGDFSPPDFHGKRTFSSATIGDDSHAVFVYID